MPAIGVTGGISTGKSTFINCLRQLFPEATFFDADVMARELTHQDTKVLAGIRKTFGDAVFAENGELNRNALRRSEERRVGKECRSRWWRYTEKKKVKDK